MEETNRSKGFQLIDPTGIPFGHFQRYEDAVIGVCIKGFGSIRKI